MLKSLDKPKITSLFANLTLEPGDTREILCNASGNPKPSVSWFKGNKTYVKDKVLKFHSVSTNLSGKYTCKAMVNNMTGFMNSQFFFLEVSGKVL